MKSMKCYAMFLFADPGYGRNERQHLAWLISNNFFTIIHVTFLKPHKEFCFIWIQVELICRRTMEATKRFHRTIMKKFLFSFFFVCVLPFGIFCFINVGEIGVCWHISQDHYLLIEPVKIAADTSCLPSTHFLTYFFKCSVIDAFKIGGKWDWFDDIVRCWKNKNRYYSEK